MIRLIVRNDIPQCAVVIRESFKTVADEFGFTPENAPRFTAFSTTDDRIYHQFDCEKRIMAAYFTESGGIIGYYSLLMQDNSECELNNLCVLPQYRHGGFGTELLNDAYDRARAAGCVKINIGIVEENTVLRKWYEKSGFIHIGTKKFGFFPFTCGYMAKSL